VQNIQYNSTKEKYLKVASIVGGKELIRLAINSS